MASPKNDPIVAASNLSDEIRSVSAGMAAAIAQFDRALKIMGTDRSGNGFKNRIILLDRIKKQIDTEIKTFEEGSQHPRLIELKVASKKLEALRYRLSRYESAIGEVRNFFTDIEQNSRMEEAINFKPVTKQERKNARKKVSQQNTPAEWRFRQGITDGSKIKPAKRKYYF